MHLFALPLKQAIILLSFLLCLPINILASEYERRGTDSLCCIGSCDDDDGGNEDPTSDGPTSDRLPGIGVEFETASIRFVSENCDKPSTDKSKGKLVNNWEGKNWKLTADTTPNEAGDLSAEYILDGTQIKIGTGAAAIAASAVANDIVRLFNSSALRNSWNKSANMYDMATIEDSTCNPWRITWPDNGAANIGWSPQITAPLPLEAISDLFSKAVADQASDLLPSIQRGRNMVYVTRDFFQTKPNGISSESINGDILGFFSLILSYAKAAKAFDEDESPKALTSIMPRTDFTNIFNQIKSAVPGTLYDIVNLLACYKNTPTGIDIDFTFCTGTVDAPQPNGQMDKKKFSVSSSDGRSDSSTVQEWIQSIQNGNSPDRLSELDQVIDGQIGGLRDALENVLNTSWAVPLFEFRRLKSIKSGAMQSRIISAEKTIIDYHKSYTNTSTHIRRRLDTKYAHIKRQGASVACDTATVTGATTTAPPPTTATLSMPLCSLQKQDPDQGINKMGCVCGSTTLPLLTVPSATDESQSCSYTAMPYSSVSNPISIETEHWTSNCQACTLIGGIADAPTCTPVIGCTSTSAATPTSTFAIFLSNNSLPIGDGNNNNNGSDMRTDMYNKLKALCPDNGNACDSTRSAEIDNIPTVVGDGLEYETLMFTFQDSHYDSPRERDLMLAASVASWQQAVGKSCKEVEYKDEADPTVSGCGTGPVKRDLPTRTELEKRSPICEDCAPPEEICTYHATICAGPDHINPVFAGSGGAYDNHMNIQLGWKLDGDSAFDEFFCDAIIDGLSAVAMAVAPELVEADIFADIEFESLCADMAESTAGLGRRAGTIGGTKVTNIKSFTDIR